MQQLRVIGTNTGVPPPPFDPEALQRLDTLTTEILEEVCFVNLFVSSLKTLCVNYFCSQAQTLENSIRHSQRLPSVTGDRGQPITSQAVVRFPEQLSIKANQLKEEYERLRSFDSDGEGNSDEDEPEAPAQRVVLPLLPPVPSEMSVAARKKIFVETHRLVFAPLETDPASPIQPAVFTEEEEEEEPIVPWRRNSVNREQPVDIAPWRKNSLTTPTDEVPPDRPATATTVRNTAPNIRRMIDKYHQKVTASGKDRLAPTFQFRPRCERSSSSTPPPAIVIENKCQTPPLASPLPDEHAGQLHPIQLSKSHSTGAMGATIENQRTGTSSTTSAAGWSGVLRSKSGHQMPSTSQAAPCVRNPSFFRKSPLDPSIDDLLQKYRCRRQVGAVPAELPKSPTANPERMLKLKQARDAFLTVGPGAIQSVVSADRHESEESIQPPTPTPSVQSTPSTSTGPTIVVEGIEAKSVVQKLCRQSLFVDITFDTCAEDSGSCRSQEGMLTEAVWSAAAGRSVPSSPAAPRRSVNDNYRRRGGNPQQQQPASRHSWLKQPTKFFFPKPKNP